MQGNRAGRIGKSIILVLATAAASLPAGSAIGQIAPAPQLATITPSGGQAGSSFEVTVVGQNLENPQGLYFSVAGIKAEIVGQSAPSKKKPPKTMAAQKSARFKVTVPADARRGIHDVRVVTRGGISNPRAFVVGDVKEFVEAEPNDDVPQAQRVELDSTVSGVIAAPTDVDYFIFKGKKGQHVVVSCLTTSIDSKLPAVIELYGNDGTYLAFNRAYHENDAVLDAVLHADGDFYVRVSSFTYTLGGPEYFYRLTISTAPWIDAVFPSVVEPGTTAQLTVFGRNLPGGKLDPENKIAGKALEKITRTVKVPGDALTGQRLTYNGWIAPNASGLDGFEFRVKNDAGASNPALVTFAAAPVVLDNGDNDTAETAQAITVPCEIAGRIEKKADRDWYVFSAAKGDVYSIELLGDRLGSPMDTYFILREAAKGKVITEQDDSTEVLSPQFSARTFDPPRYRFVVPADGDYQLMVSSRDAFVQAGPRHRYQVRITREQPDFRLVVMPTGTTNPDAAVIGQGGNQAYQVLVWRRDGFNGDVRLTARDLPPGLKLTPQMVPAGQKQAILVISADADAEIWTGPIQIEGTASINGKQLVREARAATITWPVPQANVPAISRLDRTLVLAVREKAPFNLSATGDKLSALPGGRITIAVKLTRNLPSIKGPVQLTALNLPAGFNFQNTTLAPGKDTVNVNLDVKGMAQPGSFTVVFRGQFPAIGKGGGRNPTNVLALPSTPITVTILPKQLAKLTAGTGTVKLAPGKESTLVIKLARLYDFDGPFNIKLVAPANSKGISAEELEVQAGENEARLTLNAAPGTPQGTRPNYTVRATAMFHGTAIVHEIKISVNVQSK